MTVDELAGMIKRTMASKEDLAALATKKDLLDVATKEDIQAIRDEMATKDDVKALQGELKSDIENLRKELGYGQEIDDLRQRVKRLEQKLSIT